MKAAVNYSLMYENSIKTKDFELNAYPLCLRDIPKNFAVNNMKQIGLNGYMYDFLVDYGGIYVDHILFLHKYLIKNNNPK